MSLIPCDNCGRIVDTDDDPASTVFVYDEADNELDICLCEQCREEMEVEDERA